jgi:hypothetical protein
MANNEFVYCLSGQVHPICKAYPVTNAVIYKKGDFVSISAGLVVLTTTGTAVLGTVAGVESSAHAPVGADAGYTDQWTGVTGQYVLVNVDPTSVYAVDMDAAIGAASYVGCHYDLADKDTVDESGGSTSSMQLTLVSGTTGETRGEFSVFERVLC